MFETDQELIDNSSEVFMPDTDAPGIKKGKRVLVMVPDLELNGAQTVMRNMIEIFNEEYYSITIISSEDGPYREKYTSLGCCVAIRPFVATTESFKEYMRCYDFVLLNSSSCLPYLYFFINTKTPVLLWLHETEQQLNSTGTVLPHPLLLSPNIRIAGVTMAVLRGIKNLYDCDITLLPMAVPDVHTEYGVPVRNTDVVEFFIPGAYTYIKGQDILLKVIANLPEQFARKAHFTFCGYKLTGQEEYYRGIKNIASKMGNVTFLEQLSQPEVYDYYNRSDCVVAPSRIDATPTTIVEAMMFGKHVMVSSNAGISEYLTDCVNGFVFENEDELLKRILLLVSDLGSLSGIARAGYEIYKELFSPEAVKIRLKKIMDL